MVKKTTKCDIKKCHGVPVLMLIIGILWLLADLGVIGFTLPWWPIIIIILSIGMIKHHHCK